MASLQLKLDVDGFEWRGIRAHFSLRSKNEELYKKVPHGTGQKITQTTYEIKCQATRWLASGRLTKFLAM
jgi:hypothetical protein